MLQEDGRSVDPGLLLDLELRHSSVLMLPSPSARRQLLACLHHTGLPSSSQDSAPARPGSKLLDSGKGPLPPPRLPYLFRGSPPVGSSRLVLQTAVDWSVMRWSHCLYSA